MPASRVADDLRVVPRQSLRKRLALCKSLAARCPRRALWMLVILMIPFSIAGVAVGLALRWLADGAIERNWGVALGGATVGLLAYGVLGSLPRVMYNTQEWLAVTIGFDVDRGSLESVATMPGVEHLERAEYLDQVAIVKRTALDVTRSTMAVTNVGAQLIRIVLGTVLLATVDPILGLLPLFLLPSALIVPFAQRPVERANLEAAPRERASDALHRLFFSPSASMEMRVFACSRKLDERADELWREAGRARVIAALKADLLSALGWALLALGFVGALLDVVIAARSGRASVGDVLLVSSLAFQMRNDVAMGVSFFRQAFGVLRLADRFIWLSEQAEDQAGRFAGTFPVPARIARGIQLSGVTFAYPGADEPSLEGIDLLLPAGATVALVGENGAGKSTLIKLLCCLYQPSVGSIEVDGTDLRNLDVVAWRRELSGSFQDFVRLEAQILHSVGSGDPPNMNSPERVGAALDAAEAASLTAQLPDGLRTHLGKAYRNGAELSGGQWQKVAMARAMMRPEPLLLVLDEPTAALDAQTEAAIYDRFLGLANSSRERGRITVVASHRFASVQRADLIVVLKNGHIVEKGTHHDLLARQGEYAAMYRRQAAAYQ
ncbi:MAG: transporter ATPase/permease [Acidimicrobiaceae bacterium]|nr:transporter ATPase/permease [Acidimicrobiaceae bacterium]